MKLVERVHLLLGPLLTMHVTWMRFLAHFLEGGPLISLFCWLEIILDHGIEGASCIFLWFC
jgi:hypothetical protein